MKQKKLPVPSNITLSWYQNQLSAAKALQSLQSKGLPKNQALSTVQKTIKGV